jgi:hypothetical protein
VRSPGLPYNVPAMKTASFILAIAFLLQGPLCALADMPEAGPQGSSHQGAHDCCADTSGPASVPAAPRGGDDSQMDYCEFHCATLSQILTSADLNPLNPLSAVSFVSHEKDLRNPARPAGSIPRRASELLASGDLTHQNLPLLI